VNTAIDFGASASGQIARVERFVFAAPRGFPFSLRPKVEDGVGEAPMLGVYEVMMIFTSTHGEQTACTTQLNVTTSDLLHIELTWNPDLAPGRDPSNLDLHLLHEAAPAWFDEFLDCHTTNCLRYTTTLDWGVGGLLDDNPTLARSISAGPGPETIAIPNPEQGVRYRIGVVNWFDGGAGASDAFVRVFCNGELVSEHGPAIVAGATPGGAGNHFWRVADVTFDSATSCAVDPLLNGTLFDISTLANAESTP
jgi:hypothetical protein